MTTNVERPQGIVTCAIADSSTWIYAGADFELSIAATSTPACDLRGLVVAIQDGTGKQLGSLEFTTLDDDGTCRTGTLNLAAPSEPGEHAWIAHIDAFETDGFSVAETASPLSIVVKAHTTSVVVWAVPSAVTAGSAFEIKVGAKCACGCAMNGQALDVFDPAGTLVATVALGDSTWQNTEALYYTDVALQAGDSPGLQDWEVKFSPAGLALPHSDGAARWKLNVVAAPDHTVTIEAVDRDKQTPLVGAMVSMHPYRTVTNERGVAELRVPKGIYTLFVSARQYLSDRASVEVTEDLATRAQLAVEIRPQRY